MTQSGNLYRCKKEGTHREFQKCWERMALKVKGHPTAVNVYDFLPEGRVRTVLYAIYDIARNRGFVNVGISADTAVFASRSLFILNGGKKNGNKHILKLNVYLFW